jgi:hypothetical protein
MEPLFQLFKHICIVRQCYEVMEIAMHQPIRSIIKLGTLHTPSSTQLPNHTSAEKRIQEIEKPNVVSCHNCHEEPATHLSESRKVEVKSKLRA